MTIISLATEDGQEPTLPFGVAAMPFHPELNIVGYGIDEKNVPYVDVTGAWMSLQNFASQTGQYVGDPDRFTLSGMEMLRNYILREYPAPRAAEAMQILDFATECANLLGEIGGEPEGMWITQTDRPRLTVFGG